MRTKQNLSILALALDVGGAEKVISLLLKKLVHDYRVTLILFYDNIDFLIPPQVDVVTLSKHSGQKHVILKSLDAITFIFRYNKILKKRNIKYAVSFLPLPNFINGIISTFNKSIKTIISERGFPSDNVDHKSSLRIAKIFYPILYNKCDKLFSNSVHINNDLKVNFGVKIPMEVIYNPIEIPKKQIFPNNLNVKKKSLNIITAGFLSKRKNHIMIIRAIKNSDHKLTILGIGPLKSYLTNELKNLGLEKHVDLTGKVKNVNDYLLKNDCFVLSSFTEGFPNALLEAMAIGLPCISTNCLSGPLELLNGNKEITIAKGEFYIGKYGLLVNNDDHKGLRRALDYFIENPEEREKFSVLSLKRSKEFQLENIYNHFDQFIKSELSISNGQNIPKKKYV